MRKRKKKTRVKPIADKPADVVEQPVEAEKTEEKKLHCPDCGSALRPSRSMADVWCCSYCGYNTQSRISQLDLMPWKQTGPLPWRL